MDEVLLFAVPVAAIAVVAALTRPVRERAAPVARAVGRAGVAVGGTALAGGRGIVDAAVHGESRAEGEPGAQAEAPAEAQAEAPTGKSRRRQAASSSS